MAILLRWSVPNSTDTGYDQTHIERANSENGSYSEIATQAITDNTYNDEDGSSSNWYKIRFKNTTSGNYTDYSDPLQGGTFIGYCNTSDIREITNITTDDVSDTDMQSLITKSLYELNRLINVGIVRERVLFLDQTRKNLINGSNTTFYVRNWRGKFLADRNNNGEVTTDDIQVFLVDGSGTQTEATVSSVTVDEGKFVLSSAPSSDKRMLVSYEWCFRNPSTPDSQIRLACIFLTAAYAYAKINVGRSPQTRFGNIRIFKHIESFDIYFKRAMDIVDLINEKQPDFKEAGVPDEYDPYDYRSSVGGYGTGVGYYDYGRY